MGKFKLTEVQKSKSLFTDVSILKKFLRYFMHKFSEKYIYIRQLILCEIP